MTEMTRHARTELLCHAGYRVLEAETDRKAYVASYLEVVVKRRLFEATFRFRRHEGEYRRMKSVGTARLGTDGEFLGYVGSTVDITDVPAPDEHGPLASRQAGQTDTAKAVEGYPIGDQTEDPQSRQPPASVGPASAFDGGPINILIVDDEPKNLTVLETVLDDPGYRLVRAESADQALLALVSEEFALLILDIQMPGMTGFELAQLIKERKKIAQVPIIFLTAYYNEDQHALEGYSAGAVDYLHKPVNPAVLRSKVAVFAEMHRKSRTLLNEVTERRRAENRLRELNETLEQRVTERTEALRLSEARFRTLADNISQLAWMADATGWISWYNQRWYEYTGTTFEDMQGWGWEKVHHPDHVDRVVTKWRKSHSTGEPWEDTFPLRGSDGMYRWFLSRAMPIRDTEGRVTRWFGTNTEITELREAQTALRQSEERLRSFSSQLEQLVGERTRELVQSQERLRLLATELNLAEQRERKRLAAELHDYLAQLLVLGCLKLGQVRRAGLPGKAEEMVKEIEEVLTQALDYSRTLMAELSPSVLQEHGLPAGLKWLGEQMQRQGLLVQVEVGDASSLALTNDCAVLLFQSVRELLMNALKHAGCQKVVIRLQQGEGRLGIEVRDDGIGFDLAAAGSASTAMSSKFGLFSIRERMTALGGWFNMQSAPGGGTTATLVLPLGERVRVQSSELSREAGSFSDHSVRTTQNVRRHPQDAKIRVLLVDDHAMVRQGLRSVLESYADIEIVGEARDGEEAVTATEALHPTVVLMDINMPMMNGIKATAQITSRFPGIIVIGLSVQAGGENEEAMKKAGASMLLTKEAAVEELYRAIRETLDLKRKGKVLSPKS